MSAFKLLHAFLELVGDAPSGVGLGLIPNETSPPPTSLGLLAGGYLLFKFFALLLLRC